MRLVKRDANHAEIKQAFLRVGWVVEDTAHVGGGFADLMVAPPSRDRLYLLEIKDGQKPPSARKLTPDEVKFHAKWGKLVTVVTSVEDAFRAVGLMDAKAVG